MDDDDGNAGESGASRLFKEEEHTAHPFGANYQVTAIRKEAIAKNPFLIHKIGNKQFNEFATTEMTENNQGEDIDVSDFLLNSPDHHAEHALSYQSTETNPQVNNVAPTEQSSFTNALHVQPRPVVHPQALLIQEGTSETSSTGKGLLASATSQPRKKLQTPLTHEEVNVLLKGVEDNLFRKNPFYHVAKHIFNDTRTVANLDKEFLKLCGAKDPTALSLQAKIEAARQDRNQKKEQQVVDAAGAATDAARGEEGQQL